MHMARLLVTVLVVFMVLALPTVAGAAEKDVEFPDDMDLNLMAAEIVKGINDVHGAGYISRYAKPEDVDFSVATKWYTGFDIFAIDTDNADEIERQLAAQRIGYEVPVTIEGVTFVTYLEKGKPLREGVEKILDAEQIEQIKSEVGKWIAVGVDIYDEKTPYEAPHALAARAAQASGIKGAAPIIVWALPNVGMKTVLYPDEEGNIEKVMVLGLIWLDFEALGYDQEKFDGVLNYPDLKERIRNLPPPDPNAEILYGIGEIGADTIFSKASLQTPAAADGSVAEPVDAANDGMVGGSGLSAWLIVLIVMVAGVATVGVIYAVKSRRKALR